MMIQDNKDLSTGKLFVLSGPSGTGKTTLIKKITDTLPHIVQSISFTTRKKREGEVDGKDYFFISQEEFDRGLKTDQFLEHVEIFGHYYATSRLWIDQQLMQGKNVVLVIDTQGALALKRQGVEIISIFLKPPSLEELRIRLKHRSSESDQEIEKRIRTAEDELKQAQYYDFIVVNDKLEQAYQDLKEIFTK